MVRSIISLRFRIWGDEADTVVIGARDVGRRSRA